ncbi:hypothetical protein ACT4XR_20120 (plasmid) [Acinetobacter baumannii]|uniref:hypothetical protein n=1 Tax=Acinetobacter baumannii TaxID=470 RepID=UPI003892159B
MRIFKYELEEALQSLDNSFNYVGFINKLFPSCTSNNFENLNTFSLNILLKKIQDLLSAGYYSVFINYKNYMPNGERVWGIHHFCMCIYLHENFEPFGSYSWDTSLHPQVILDFWSLTSLNKYELCEVGLTYNQVNNFDHTERLNIDIEMAWEELAILNPTFNFPFFRNIFYLSCLSIFNISDYQKFGKLLSLNYSLDHLIDQLSLNLFNFLDLLDDYMLNIELSESTYSYIDSSSFTMFAEVSEQDLINYDLSFVSDSSSSEDSTAQHSQTSSTSNSYTAPSLVDKSYLAFLSKQDIHEEITSDYVRELIKQFFYNYSKVSFSIHNTSIPSGFLADFLDYLNRSLEQIFIKIESLKVNYLKLQFIYQTSHTLSSMYFYKYIVDNYTAIFINFSVPESLKKEVLIKVRSLSIFIKNKINKLNDVLVHDPLFVNVYSLVFFYINSFSQTLNFIRCSGGKLDKDRLDVIYNNELEYIDSLDFNFFQYLARRLPRQVYRLP